MGAIINTARAIMACLQPLVGTRSTGSVLVTASGDDVSLPRNSYAIPIVAEQQRPDLAVKVAEGTGTDGAWTVTSSGTTVSMFSNLGGTVCNLDSGTEFFFDPPIAGIASVVASTPFLGGINSAEYGALKDIVMTEHIGALQMDLSRSPIKGFPAMLVTWSDAEPVDGATTSARSPRESRLGTRKNLYKLTYQLTVISSRDDGDHIRRAVGLEIVDRAVRALVDVHAIDGEHISNPSGLQVLRWWRETRGGEAFQRYYVYAMLVDAMVTVQRIDARTYSNWVSTVLNVDKQLDDETDIRLVDTVEIEMEQD